MYAPYNIYTEVSIRSLGERVSKCSAGGNIDIFKYRNTISRNTVAFVECTDLSNHLRSTAGVSREKYRRASRGIGVSLAIPTRDFWAVSTREWLTPSSSSSSFLSGAPLATGEPCKCLSRREETRAESIGEARREVRARRHAPQERERKRGAAGNSTVSVKSWRPRRATPGTGGRRVHAAEADRLLRRGSPGNGPRESSSRDKLDDWDGYARFVIAWNNTSGKIAREKEEKKIEITGGCVARRTTVMPPPSTRTSHVVHWLPSDLITGERTVSF